MNMGFESLQPTLIDTGSSAAFHANPHAQQRNPAGINRESRPHQPPLLMRAPGRSGLDTVGLTSRQQQGASVRAMRQWHGLHEILARHRRIEMLASGSDPACSPLVAHAGLAFRRKWVPARASGGMRLHDDLHLRHVAEGFGFEPCDLPESIRFGGASDVIHDAALEVLWIGVGPHCELPAAAGLARLLDIDTVPLRLADPRFERLDTCFSLLPGGVLLWYPPAFDADSRALVESRIDALRRIAISENDALAFACNAINLGSALVLHRASARLKRELDDAGFTVIETPLDAFHKRGGSARSLALRVG
ncbi:dimethylarginine dimethylaminohydrolase family protein [Dokdonella sp.]|uniref:dimethylarginine dimethylaminohydrolase family protein n=1 Tax=Dokdonella sp. TaxID=2291710 RepID=UPI0035281C0F